MRYIETLSLVLAAGSFFPHAPKSLQPPSLPVRQFVSDMRTKNIDDVLNLYAPDAVLVDPDGNKFTTPDELRKLYVQTFATYDSDIEFNRTSLKLKGDTSKGSTATETDDYRENLRVRETRQVHTVCGTATSKWIKENDGAWLISSQVWTTKPCLPTQ